MFSAAEHGWMARALQLAARGRCSTHPNPRVGCVVVRNGRIVGEGAHYVAGGPHAEVMALREAGEAARGGTAFVTLEPCCHHGRTPPCTDALIAAGLRRVVFAARDSNPHVAGAGARQLRSAGIAVAGDLLAPESRALNRGFFSRLERGRPFVVLKLAMSLDGKVALANGQSQWVSGPESRADVQRLRADSSAVLTGIGTVLADDPALTVRDPRFDLRGRQPMRVILDSHLRTPTTARMLSLPGETRIFTTTADGARMAVLGRAGAIVERIAPAGPRVALAAVLERLAALDVNELLVEAGPALAGAFLDAGLVDELVLYVAPRLFGAAARSAFEIAGPAALEDALGLSIVEERAVGGDRRIVARLRPSDHADGSRPPPARP